MSGLTFGTASGAEDAAEIHIGTGAGNAQVTEGWIGAAGGNKQFFAGAGVGSEPLSATASPESQSWGGSGFDRTAELAVEITGGIEPYSIEWFGEGADLTLIAGADQPTATAHSTSDATASFYAQVTDAAASVVTTNTIAVHA